MLMQVFFTPDEIRKFFTENGYQVVTADFGKWVPSYHNKSEWVTCPADAVIIGDNKIEASKLFEKVIEHRMKRMIAPVSIEMQRVIGIELKKLKR